MAHELPILPYEYGDLDPHIDKQTMTIHYSKHHAGYVNNLNNALSGTGLETTSLEELLSTILSPDSVVPADKRTAVRNNGGGHWNHSLYWSVLSPQGGGEPSGNLMEAVASSFGDLPSFISAMKTKGMGVFGSGWVWALVNSTGKLEIAATANQDNPIMNGVPANKIILGIDVWEHAYYLKHQNMRANYLDDIWNVIDWNEAANRFEKA